MFSRQTHTCWFAIAAAFLLSFSGCAVELSKDSKQPTAAMSAPVLALYNEGARLFREKDFHKAEEKYRAAWEQAQAADDVSGVGFSLAGLGAAQAALKEYDQALDSFQGALPYLKGSRNTAVEALTFAAVGEVEIQLGHHARAIEAFDQALTIAEKLFEKASDQDKLLILTHREKVLSMKAQAHERLGNYREAVKSYLNAADDSRKTGNIVLASAALWGAASGSEKVGDLEQAIALYTEASSLAERVGNIKDATWMKWGLGQAQFAAGKFEDSIRTFSLVAKVAETEGLTDLTASAYFGLGQSFENLSDFENALAGYRSALGALRRAGNWKDKTTLEAGTLYHMGVIHRWLSQYEEAIENVRVAALKYQQIDHLGGQAVAFAQLAEIFSWIAEPKSAVVYYKNALEIYKKIGDLPRQVEILAALGEAGYLTDEVTTEDGEMYFREGQQLVASLTGIDPYGRAKTSTDAPDKIMREWREKLPTLQTNYRMAAGILYQKWGRVFLDANKLQTAFGMLLIAFQYHSISPLLRSIEINRQVAIELAKDAYFLGEAFRQGRAVEEALKYFRMVEQLASRLRTPEIHFAYAGLARTYADLGDTDKALEYYKKGIAILESIQGQQGTEDIKIGVIAGALHTYRDFLRLLLDVHTKTKEQRYLDDSFAYNEKWKARVFLEMLARSQKARLRQNVSSEAISLENVRRKIAQIHHRLQTPKLEQLEEAKLLDELESLRQTWRGLQKEIAKRDPRYSRALSPQLATVANVQAALDADTALLEYSISYDGSILWVITKEKIRAHKLPGADLQSTLESYLKTVRQPLIGEDEISSHARLGRKLYRELLGPAEELIQGKKHLIIAPDGPLYYLPFEALIISKNQTRKRPTKLSDVDYLLSQYRITYIPSASVLVAQRSEQPANFTKTRLPLLAFGDPVYNETGDSPSPDVLTDKITNLALRGQNLKRLKFSGDEVLRIARVWGVSPTSQNIYLRDQASMGHLRSLDLSQYRIIHFATHAILGDQVKSLSQPALVLSQPEGGDVDAGLLQFSDILELKLTADLVVLSACETGLGRLQEGEGIVGLTRAFLYAGASSTVVSLWKVEDQSTGLLMEEFYQQLKKGANKSEALRQAKLNLMRRTIRLEALGSEQALSAPFYWAPFILFGDSGRVLDN